MATSASISTTSTSLSAARLSARLIAQKVLPSSGRAEQTRIVATIACTSRAWRSSWRFTMRNSSAIALGAASGTMKPPSAQLVRSPPGRNGRSARQSCHGGVGARRDGIATGAGDERPSRHGMDGPAQRGVEIIDIGRPLDERGPRGPRGGIRPWGPARWACACSCLAPHAIKPRCTNSTPSNSNIRSRPARRRRP